MFNFNELNLKLNTFNLNLESNYSDCNYWNYPLHSESDSALEDCKPKN